MDLVSMTKVSPLEKKNNNHASHFHSTLFPHLSHFETSLSGLENDMTRPPGTQGRAEIGFLEGQR